VRPTEEEILKSVEDVVDPEVQASIVEMNLIDEVDIGSDHTVRIKFHLTTPFCPAEFALSIAMSVKERVSSIPGVNRVIVEVKDHFMATEINAAVNGADWLSRQENDGEEKRREEN